MNKYITNINKYIKYKSKYLDLYSNQFGGSIDLKDLVLNIKLPTEEKYIKTDDIISINHDIKSNKYIIKLKKDSNLFADLHRSGMPFITIKAENIEFPDDKYLILGNYESINEINDGQINSINLTFNSDTILASIKSIYIAELIYYIQNNYIVDIFNFIFNKLKNNFYDGIIDNTIDTIAYSKNESLDKFKLLSIIFSNTSLNNTNKQKLFYALNELHTKKEKEKDSTKNSNKLEIADGANKIDKQTYESYQNKQNKPVFCKSKCIICYTGIPELKQKMAEKLYILNNNIDRQKYCDNCKKYKTLTQKQEQQTQLNLSDYSDEEMNKVLNYPKLITDEHINYFINLIDVSKCEKSIKDSSLSEYDKFKIFKNCFEKRKNDASNFELDLVVKYLIEVTKKMPIVENPAEVANGFNFFSITDFNSIDTQTTLPIFKKSNCLTCDKMFKEVSIAMVSVHFKNEITDYERQFICQQCRGRYLKPAPAPAPVKPAPAPVKQVISAKPSISWGDIE